MNTGKGKNLLNKKNEIDSLFEAQHMVQGIWEPLILRTQKYKATGKVYSGTV